jgi:hypothetical protein
VTRVVLPTKIITVGRSQVTGSDTELIEQLADRLRAADAILAGLADDMAAVGASSASERTERARTALSEAVALAAEVLRRNEPGATVTPDAGTDVGSHLA